MGGRTLAAAERREALSAARAGKPSSSWWCENSVDPPGSGVRTDPWFIELSRSGNGGVLALSVGQDEHTGAGQNLQAQEGPLDPLIGLLGLDSAD